MRFSSKTGASSRSPSCAPSSGVDTSRSGCSQSVWAPMDTRRTSTPIGTNSHRAPYAGTVEITCRHGHPPTASGTSCLMPSWPDLPLSLWSVTPRSWRPHRPRRARCKRVGALRLVDRASRAGAARPQRSRLEGGSAGRRGGRCARLGGLLLLRLEALCCPAVAHSFDPAEPSCGHH